MREILFRGKPYKPGLCYNHCQDGWMYGFFATKGGASYITEVGKYASGKPYFSDSIVDPETVGQFTGLTDKNGKKIFEGDIVRILGNQDVEDWKNVDYTALIAFLDGGFCAIDGTIEEHGFRRYALARLDFSLEVIGNIHDNPELLGGAEDG